ncbi:MAG: DUF5009 domain-containing protein [Asticcacaulis sp.]|uniref:DUF5009 domain-containing protein n=1 Tax=Asticcacaulis sp. TaxID=1872648 RepID=UPI0039E6AA91
MSDATPSARVDAIDILRAMTMVLMIFVNDLWSLTGIPGWLEHVPRGVDGLGLADTVFPAFLFIVGMSLPFAIDHRRAKGDSDRQLAGHAILRAVALLVMGVFLVNGETINPKATGFSGSLWDVLCATAFILVWNSYPSRLPTWVRHAMKGLGVLTLLVLAFIYRGGEAGHLTSFTPQWWGILGLIGWAYLVSALVVIAAKGRLTMLVMAWAAFSALSLLYAAKLVPAPLHLLPEPIIDGTMTALTLGGVVTARLFQIFQNRDRKARLLTILAVIALCLIGLAVWTRPYWGISKLAATPAWLFLCSALTLLVFMAIYTVTDLAGKARWFAVIRPAGTDTLLCYLVPLFLYGLIDATGLELPDPWLTGGLGLIKSLIFALACVWVTAALRRAGLRLKL